MGLPNIESGMRFIQGAFVIKVQTATVSAKKHDIEKEVAALPTRKGTLFFWVIEFVWRAWYMYCVIGNGFHSAKIKYLVSGFPSGTTCLHFPGSPIVFWIDEIKTSYPKRCICLIEKERKILLYTKICATVHLLCVDRSGRDYISLPEQAEERICVCQLELESFAINHFSISSTRTYQ